jgi:hypothetical protein
VCTGIVETAEVSGSGKGPNGWFKLERVNVSYDHPTDASLEHGLNIDFVNQKEGPSARVAVELSPESAQRLVKAILAALSQAGQGLPAHQTLPEMRAIGEEYAQDGNIA